MGSILAARDIGSDFNGVRNTFSSWDKCMEKTYCKWPVIAAIIIGSLIVLSLLSCLFRCLCCGVECCCGCLSCCNACCPSPRRSRQGYQQQPPPPPTPYQQYPTYNQYHQPQQPLPFASGALGYRSAPQTATFDAPSNKPGAIANADALPPMPTWDTAHTRRVEHEDEMEPEDVEMEKLVTRPSPQPQSPWHQDPNPFNPQNPAHGPAGVGGGAGGGVGATIAAGDNRYQPPEQRDPYASDPYYNNNSSSTYDARSGGLNDPYTQPSHYPSNTANPYESYATDPPQRSDRNHHHHNDYYSNGNNPYQYTGPHSDSYNPYGNEHGHVESAAYPPSYATSPPSPPRMTSPPAARGPAAATSAAAAAAGRPPSGLQIGRKPLQGSWREV